jgi:CHAD domain-containing protein
MKPSMPYLLAQDETIPGGLRRIAREEIDAAIENLRVTQVSKRDPAVHEARKSIKKLRGLVRLLLPQLGAEGPRENAVLRDLGRTLAEVRDAAAMIETVDLLGKKYHDDPAIPGLARIRSALVKRRNAARVHADSTTAAEEGVLALRRLRRRLNAWDLGPEFSSLAPGLRKTYRRGRRALSRARKNPDADHLHNLRKRVKDYWYQVRLLESLWITPEASPEQGLKKLQEDLGDAHNLAVLRETPMAGSESVAHMIDDFEKQLRVKSLASAKELYADKPHAHTARLVELWAAWRGDAGRKTPNPAPPTSEAISAA